MNYRDRFETDEDGNRFVFTVEMQRALVAQGLPAEPEYLSQLTARPPARPARGERYGDEAAPARARQAPERDRRREGDYGRREATPAPAEPAMEEPETIQIDPMSGKYLGRLKWYNAGRGYGFIARGGGEDIFFHKSDVLVDPENLAEGTWVLYDVEETAKGLEASDVEVYVSDEEE